MNLPHSDRRYVIGLTGNIATGKSAVMEILRRLGACTIDADAVVHQVLSSNEAVRRAVIEEFGPGVLNADGSIDRAALGRVVFGNRRALARLEAIVHPVVIRMVDDLIARAAERVIVVEAIKLIESGMHRGYDALWVVAAPPAQQLDRLVKQRGMDAADARQRIAAQPPQEEKIAVADFVIYNDGPLADLERRVTAEWQRIQRELDRPPAGGTRRTTGER